MTEIAFPLLIKDASSRKRVESVSCTDLLRTIPGRRQVYSALWNNRSVIVKVFSHRFSARRHVKREWEGLSKLTKLGANSPKPLFYGKTEDGRWVLVLEKIVGSSTVLDAFRKTKDTAKKRDLLVLVCKELAKQHIKGVLQKDLHLGNFLLIDGKVFLLDVAQMRFLLREVDKKTSISQLAMLARYLRTNEHGATGKICREYFNVRGWRLEKADETFLLKQITAHRKKDVKKGFKKCLRTSKNYLRIKKAGYLAVFDRDFCLGAEPFDFIEQIDALMNEGKILKNGNTCYVSRLTWNGKDVVVKRYNHKGFVHSLCHTIKKSRAWRGWLHAHRLRILRIPTPKPLAYIEQRKQKLVWRSYLVTEYIEGRRLYDFLRDSKTSEEERSRVTKQIAELLDKLAKYKIIHGDLKHTNILITDSGPVLADLDAMKAHKLRWIYNIRRVKETDAFLSRIDISLASNE
jgi:tRNA A-37 threonylcarbamoyl transferase component Bud32